MEKDSDSHNITKLKNAEDYNLWKFQIDIFLASKNLIQHVRPLSGGNSSAEKVKEEEKRETNDAKVKFYITSTVDQSVLVHLLTCNTAREMYDTIRSIFERDSSQQKCALLTKFYTYSWANDKTYQENISELKNMAFKLKTLKCEVSDEMLVARITSALPSSLAHFMTAWESTPNAEKNINNLTARLILEEASQSRADEAGAVALKVSDSRGGRKGGKQDTHKKTCYTCGMAGHMSFQCRKKRNSGAGSSGYNQQPKSQNSQQSKPQYSQQKPQQSPRGNNICRICKKGGHLERECYFLDQQQPSKTEHDAKVVFLANTAQETSQNHLFVVDSGATRHLTHTDNSLKNSQAKPLSFNIANKNNSLKSSVSGDIETENLILTDVAYCPDLNCNLLSVGKVTNAGGTVTFTKNSVVISQNDDVVVEGRKTSSGLYVVNLKQSETENAMIVSEWHKRLGHLGVQNMKKLEKMSEGMKLSNCDDNIKCEICVKAKHARAPFDGHLPKAKRVNEIVHSDVCGPFENSYNNMRYYVSFLDDFSHRCEIIPIKHKSDVADVFKNYVERVENLHSCKVVTLKCDGGGEYVALKSFCEKRGIVMDVTPPYSPSINSHAERLNRLITERCRALLFEGNVSKNLWPEAVQVACYIINRSPYKNLSVTPHEIWTGEKPDLSKMRIFGETAFAKKLHNVRKLDERSEKMIFVGYASSGYRLWNGHKIVISRDVVFMSPEPETSRENTISLDISDNVSVDENFSDVETVDPDPANDDVMTPIGKRLRPRDNNKVYVDDVSESIIEALDETALITYQEAIECENSDKWINAIESEKSALLENCTWEYVDRKDAKGRKVLTSRWVFKEKPSENGPIYKARLTIRGFEQIPGLDYHDTYSPVVNFTAFRTLCAAAAAKNFKCQIFDIKTAFLNGRLDEDIYMEIPLGFEPNQNKIVKLKKSLYGLKQAPLCWNKTFTDALRKLGLKPLKSDPCIMRDEAGTVFLAHHVDDGCIFAETQDKINVLIEGLKKFFKLSLCDGKSYLGIDLSFDHGIELSQGQYIEGLLEKHKMKEANPTKTPIVKRGKILDANCVENYPYREVVGGLLYASTKTRPDISYAVGVCAGSCHNPSNESVGDVKRTLRYLKGTKDYGIKYQKGGNVDKLDVYTDSDLGEERSTTGYICILNGGPVAWASKKQNSVALSSAESEFVAATEAVKEITFLNFLLSEITGKIPETVLHIDNQSTIAMIRAGSFSSKHKHVNRKFNFIFESYARKSFEIQYCNTKCQLADVLTKPLEKGTFERFRNLLITL